MSFTRAPNTGAQNPSSSARRWSALFDQFLPAIYGFIFGQVGNREDAEHLTTQVFTEAARLLPSPDDSHAVSQLLCRQARERVATHLRQFYALAAADAGTIQAGKWEALLTAHSDQSRAAPERVEQMLAQVSAQARDLLTQRLLAGQSLETTAVALRLSVDDARQLQYDALLRASKSVPAMHVEQASQPSQAEPCCQAGG